jgi:hypothetical protein
VSQALASLQLNLTALETWLAVRQVVMGWADQMLTVWLTSQAVDWVQQLPVGC